jgi:hypothetical protein
LTICESAAIDVVGHQRPRVCLVPEIEVTDSGDMALEICGRAGLALDPWQKFVLTSSLGERADGRWSAFEVGEVVARQNGKGTTLEARELTGLFAIDEERLIIHSAHEQLTSSEHQRRLLDLIEGVPEFDQKVLRAPTGKGMEAIELRDGSRILFKTRTSGGGRGLTGDLVVLDEAMIITLATMATLIPTMAARSMNGNPQIWYTGSAVDKEKHEHGVVLARVRERGIKGDPRLMYVEWSAPGDDPGQVPESARLDPHAWAQANPGLGIRISAEYVADERRAMGAREFCVERLTIGDWPDTSENGEQVIADEAWLALVDTASKRVGPVSFFYDVTPDGRKAAIAVGGRRDDGLQHVEIVEHRDGTGWLVDRLEELQDRHGPEAIQCDGRNPAAAKFVDELALRGVYVDEIDTSEHAQACSGLVNAVTDGTFRHLGTPEVLAALKGATKRTVGDGWLWSRKSSAVDISPLVVLTGALRKAELMAGSAYADNDILIA